MQAGQKKLGFGFMRLPVTAGGEQTDIDMPAVEEMVDTFLERGFTYFDTAYMYHGFKSEIALRETLVKRHPRDAFTVATKLPTMFLKEEGDQERIFDEQLEKCGVEYFDYYLLHNLNASHYPIAERFSSFDFIARKKAEGLVRNIGFSYHDRAELLDRILTEHPEVDFVQLQMNYLDWDNESIQSRKCYEVARKHGKPVIVMEPVKGGMLASVPPAVEMLFEEYAPDLSVASWAIRFAAGHKGVMTVLSGMSDMQQLLGNTSYMQHFAPLSAEEGVVLDRAVAAIRESNPIPCTACRYCVDDCPMGIAIPEYFALFNAEEPAPKSAFSLQKLYYGNLAQTHGKASECIERGACEDACPQHIKVIEYLKDVASEFE